MIPFYNFSFSPFLNSSLELNVATLVEYLFYGAILLLGWAMKQLWQSSKKQIEEMSRGSKEQIKDCILELKNVELRVDVKVDRLRVEQSETNALLHERISTQSTRIHERISDMAERLSAVEANVLAIKGSQSSMEGKIDTLLLRGGGHVT